MCSSYTWKYPCGHTHTEKQFCKRARRKTVTVRQEGSDQERGRSKTPRSSSRSSTPPSPQVQPSQPPQTPQPSTPQPSTPQPSTPQPSTPQPSTPPPLSPFNSNSESDTSSGPPSPATPNPHQRSSRSRSPSGTNHNHRSRSTLRPHRGLWAKSAEPSSPPPQPATPTPKKEATKRTPLPTTPEPKPKIPTKARRHRELFPCRNALYLVNDNPTNVCPLPGCRYEELGRLWACCRCEKRGREVVGKREIRCGHGVCEGCVCTGQASARKRETFP